jgi:DNA-binding transcriptional LysR family regulator
MEIRELESLAMLARTGSITRAAELLHRTPPAVHRHLQLLARELDIPLYEKTGGGLRLTKAASGLLPLVEELLIQHGSLRAAARDWHDLRRGTVTVAAGPTFSSYVLPGLLEKYRGAHPGLEVVLEAGHTTLLLEELARGSVDLVFLVPGAGIEKQFMVEKIWEFGVPVMANSASAPRRPVRLAELERHPFLLYKQGSVFEEVIDRYFASHDFAPRVAMRLDNAEPMKALVRSGFGMALLPDWAVRSELRERQLVEVKLKEAPLRCKLALIRRNSRYIAAPVRALIDIAKDWKWD